MTAARSLQFSAARPARLGVLISGRGSNMVALADAAQAPGAPFQIALVASDQEDAPGLELAAARGFATAAVRRRDYPGDAPGFEAALTARLRASSCDVICLAGFMRILSDRFLDGPWADRVLNIHPSLLPAFRGLDTHARALAAGVRIHGATVHLARPAVDDGPILAQAAVPVAPDDDAERLATRVLAEEHRLYPAALAAFVTGAIWLSADGARMEGAVISS
ncbi:MAG: phosphoribosylglycinamide formyltransferase, partial [Pseudomonadota bacterium]